MPCARVRVCVWALHSERREQAREAEERKRREQRGLYDLSGSGLAQWLASDGVLGQAGHLHVLKWLLNFTCPSCHAIVDPDTRSNGRSCVRHYIPNCSYFTRNFQQFKECI